VGVSAVRTRKIDRCISESKNPKLYKDALNELNKIFLERGIKTVSFEGNIQRLIKNEVEDDLINRCLRLYELKNKITEERFKLLFKADCWEEKWKEHKKSLASSTKESYIRIYGEDIGLKKWNVYLKFQSTKNSKEYKMKKHGMSSEEVDEYNKNRSATLKNFIKRHGEDIGKQKWDEYRNRQRYAGSSEKYFIEKFGKEEGKKEWKRVCSEKALTLLNFQRKYGEIEGTIRFEQFISSLKVPFSKISQHFFWKLFDSLNENEKEHCYFGEHIKEFRKIDKSEKKCYYYDFVISSLKYCIEFNGAVFHADPNQFKGTDTPNPFNKELTAENIWKQDSIKIKFLENEGFIVDVVWESEKDDVEKFIKRINDVRNMRKLEN
jgi:G:T-mismatch repair DNA endonuclease (very short patch repair protein)